MRFAFIAKHRGIWPVAWMCGALGVSRSSFHAWLTRAPSRRALDDEVIGCRIRASHVGSYRTYGARRVWHGLLAEGICCGLHRVERLMRAQGLRARPRRRGVCRRIRANARSSPTTFWIASSRPTGPTRSGWQTSPTSGLPKDGFTWPPSSTCSLIVQLHGTPFFANRYSLLAMFLGHILCACRTHVPSPPAAGRPTSPSTAIALRRRARWGSTSRRPANAAWSRRSRKRAPLAGSKRTATRSNPTTGISKSTACLSQTCGCSELAQFDVHRLANRPALVIDCQTELLDHIGSRFVVPLVPAASAPTPARQLNPSFPIGDADYVMLALNWRRPWIGGSSGKSWPRSPRTAARS